MKWSKKMEREFKITIKNNWLKDSLVRQQKAETSRVKAEVDHYREVLKKVKWGQQHTHKIQTRQKTKRMKSRR
jgi:translation initiation factor 2 beta subunit (eIF-2beta)/eIF-5